MTPERAQLIQDLAKIEIAEMLLGKAAYANEPNFDERHHLAQVHGNMQSVWAQRANDARFTPAENAEFQRVRGEFMRLAAAALNFAATPKTPR